MSRLFTAAVLCLLVASTASAQRRKPPLNDGPMIMIGGGGGSASVTCDTACGAGYVAGRKMGPSGFFRVGGAARPDLVLYVGMSVWNKNDTTHTTVNLPQVGFEYFPLATVKSFYVNAAAGFANMITRVEFFSNKSDGQSGQGLGFEVGAGYDQLVSGNLTVGAYASFAATATVKFQDAVSRQRANILNVGVTLGLH